MSQSIMVATIMANSNMTPININNIIFLQLWLLSPKWSLKVSIYSIPRASWSFMIHKIHFKIKLTAVPLEHWRELRWPEKVLFHNTFIGAINHLNGAMGVMKHKINLTKYMPVFLPMSDNLHTALRRKLNIYSFVC